MQSQQCLQVDGDGLAVLAGGICWLPARSLCCLRKNGGEMSGHVNYLRLKLPARVRGRTQFSHQ